MEELNKDQIKKQEEYLTSILGVNLFRKTFPHSNDFKGAGGNDVLILNVSYDTNKAYVKQILDSITTFYGLSLEDLEAEVTKIAEWVSSKYRMHISYTFYAKKPVESCSWALSGVNYFLLMETPLALGKVIAKMGEGEVDAIINDIIHIVVKVKTKDGIITNTIFQLEKVLCKKWVEDNQAEILDVSPITEENLKYVKELWQHTTGHYGLSS